MIEIAACVLIADFFAGLIHWTYDTYFNPNWKNVFGHVAKSSIRHHKTPWGIRESSFWRRNGEGGTIGLVLAGLAYWLIGGWQVPFIFILAGFGNEFHFWSHEKPSKIPKPIAFLQKIRVMQTIKHHSNHHVRPYACYFCSITSVVNPVLEGIRFWRGLEWLLSKVGIHPLRCKDERHGY